MTVLLLVNQIKGLCANPSHNAASSTLWMPRPVQSLDESDSCAATKSCASLIHDCFALRRGPLLECLMTVTHQGELAHPPHPIDMLERAAKEQRDVVWGV